MLWDASGFPLEARLVSDRTPASWWLWRRTWDSARPRRGRPGSPSTRFRRMRKAGAEVEGAYTRQVRVAEAIRVAPTFDAGAPACGGGGFAPPPVFELPRSRSRPRVGRPFRGGSAKSAPWRSRPRRGLARGAERPRLAAAAGPVRAAHRDRCRELVPTLARISILVLRLVFGFVHLRI